MLIKDSERETSLAESTIAEEVTPTQTAAGCLLYTSDAADE